MRLSWKNYGWRNSKFFRININYDTLGNYYQTNFAMIHHHKYSLTELENMMPWERQVYVDMLIKFLEEETERIKEQQRQQR